MDIKKTIDADYMALQIAGRLETTSAPMLQSEISAIPPEVKRMLLDLTAVEYVSSAGLRVILFAHREMTGRSGRLEVTGANAIVKRTLDIAGFSSILNFV